MIHAMETANRIGCFRLLSAMAATSSGLGETKHESIGGPCTTWIVEYFISQSLTEANNCKAEHYIMPFVLIGFEIKSW